MRVTSLRGDETDRIGRLSASLREFPQLAAVISNFQEVLEETSPAPLLIGVSGGGDSVALLLLLRLWGRRKLIVAHVDHGLQSQSSVWAQGVESLCRSIDVRFIGLKWADPISGPGVTNAARLARHRLLADAARNQGASIVCLGHNLDDAREAAWMRAQGSNTGTAKGFAPSPVWPEGREVFLYRPLIGIGRQVLRDWLRGAGVEYLDDPANADVRYLRSKARLALADQAEMVSSEVRQNGPVVDRETYEALWSQPRAFEPLGVIALNTDLLKTLTPEQGQKVLAAGSVAAGGGEALPASARVKALMDWLETPISKGMVQKRTLCGALLVRTPEHLYLGRDMGDVRLKRRDSGLDPLHLEAGQGAVWDGRFEIKALKSIAICPNIGQGLMRSKALTPDARARLRALPSDLRRGLPVVTEGDLTKMASAPFALWENYNLPLYSARLRVRALVASRFAAALGFVVKEPHSRAQELMD